jgi:hypothetical protein
MKIVLYPAIIALLLLGGILDAIAIAARDTSEDCDRLIDRLNRRLDRAPDSE